MKLMLGLVALWEGLGVLAVAVVIMLGIVIVVIVRSCFPGVRRCWMEERYQHHLHLCPCVIVIASYFLFIYGPSYVVRVPHTTNAADHALARTVIIGQLMQGDWGL